SGNRGDDRQVRELFKIAGRARRQSPAPASGQAREGGGVMSGRNVVNYRPSDAALAAALRALPDAAPVPDLWPDLARSLDARRRRPRRYALPIALAASVALAFVLPKLANHDVAAPPSTPVANVSPPATDTTELSHLHRRSQSLERWIAA